MGKFIVQETILIRQDLFLTSKKSLCFSLFTRTINTASKNYNLHNQFIKVFACIHANK